MRKPFFFCICENKDTDQLRGNREADQRLCFRYTDSTITLLPKSEISSLYPYSVIAQPGLCRTWSETPKTGFLRTRLKCEHSTETDIKTSNRENNTRSIALEWPVMFIREKLGHTAVLALKASSVTLMTWQRSQWIYMYCKFAIFNMAVVSKTDISRKNTKIFQICLEN